MKVSIVMVVASFSLTFAFAQSYYGNSYGMGDNQYPSYNYGGYGSYGMSTNQYSYGGCPMAQPQQKYMPQAMKPAPKASSMRLEQKYPKLVIMFTGNNCPYCDYMKPVMQQAQARFPKDVTFLTINTSQYTQYPSQYGFSFIPHIMYFKNGKTMETHGSDEKRMTASQVLQKVQKHFAK